MPSETTPKSNSLATVFVTFSTAKNILYQLKTLSCFFCWGDVKCVEHHLVYVLKRALLNSAGPTNKSVCSVWLPHLLIRLLCYHFEIFLYTDFLARDLVLRALLFSPLSIAFLLCVTSQSN